MEFEKKKVIKKISYLLFFVFLILSFLMWLPSYIRQVLTCEDSPGSVQRFPDFIYKINDWVISIEDEIGFSFVIIFLVLFVLIILIGLLQKRFLDTLIFVSLIILIFMCTLVSSQRWMVGADVKRTSDLEKIQRALWAYYNNNKKYPGVSESNQINILNQVLIPTYLPELPQDPCFNRNSNWTYEYWVSSDGQDFVLKANRQSWGGPDDLDGYILGAFCGENGYWEREYCIGKLFKE